MIWKKKELAALPCLNPPPAVPPHQPAKPLWAAATVEYMGATILQIEMFNHTGQRQLRHWVAPGCAKYISLREDGSWSTGLLGTQEPLCGRWGKLYGSLSNLPQDNPAAEAVLISWDKSLGRWRNPLRELADQENTAAWVVRNRRKAVRQDHTMELFRSLCEKDLDPTMKVKVTAEREIRRNIGAEGYMLWWPYRIKNPLTREWLPCSKGFCTVCQTNTVLWPEDMPQPVAGQQTTVACCPSCGEPVAYVRTTKVHHAAQRVYTLRLFRASTGHAVAVQYITNQSYTVQRLGKERLIREHYSTNAANVVIFTAKGAVAVSACEGGMYQGSRYDFTGIWRPRDTVMDLYGVVLPIHWQDLVGTALEKSHVWEHMQSPNPRPVLYAAKYLRYPLIENLTTAGLHEIVDDILFGNETSTVDLRQASPAKALGLSKPVLDRAKRCTWRLSDVAAYKWLLAHGLPTDEKSVAEWRYHSNESVLKELMTGCDGELEKEKRLYRYLKKCETQNLRQTAVLYRDYLRFASELGYDLMQAENRYPHNLQVMHDRLAKQVRQRKNKSTNEKMALVAAALERFAWAADGLSIRPARSVEELTEEGKQLHHCVATYATRYAQGGTALFFIRRSEEPDKPFYTLELDTESMTVVQNHGDHNTLQTQEVKEFEQKWLAWAVKQEQARRRKENQIAVNCKKAEGDAA